MNLKRTVYHIAGKDYEKNEPIKFDITLQLVSAQAILKLAHSCGLGVKKYSAIQINKSWNYGHSLNTRTFTFVGFGDGFAKLFYEFGFIAQSQIREGMTVLNSKFRATNTRYVQRYNGFTCFDPLTRTLSFKSNAPAKIEGKQAVINGKLWRKYSNS